MTRYDHNTPLTLLLTPTEIESEPLSHLGVVQRAPVVEQLGKGDKVKTAFEPLQETSNRCKHGFAIALRTGLPIPGDCVVEEHDAAWLDSLCQYVGHPGWVPLQPILSIQAPADDLIAKRDGIQV